MSDQVEARHAANASGSPCGLCRLIGMAVTSILLAWLLCFACVLVLLLVLKPDQPFGASEEFVLLLALVIFWRRVCRAEKLAARGG